MSQYNGKQYAMPHILRFNYSSFTLHKVKVGTNMTKFEECDMI